MQVECSSMESCFGFISNSLKNQKEWNNQNQILRVKNKEEKHDNNEKDKRPRLFGIEKYEGVNMKTYLRGVPLSLQNKPSKNNNLSPKKNK